MSYYKAGTWNCICALCGAEFKSDEMIKRWDGVLVCKADFETRHIADFLRAVPEHGSVPFTAPEPEDVFVVVPYLYSRQGQADIGVADLAGADFYNPNL